MKRLNFSLGLGALLMMAGLQAQADGHAKADGNKIYGDFRYSVGQTETGGADGNFTAVDNASRVGFKGMQTTGKWTVKYKIEVAADTDTGAGGARAFSNRLAYVGLGYEGAGMLKAGIMSTPYKMAGVKLDPFYDTAAGVGATGGSWGQSNLVNGFTNNSIHYWSPEFMGARVNVGTTHADGAAATTTNDYNFGLTWAGMGAHAGVQFLTSRNALTTNSTAGDEAMRLWAKYGMDAWSLAVSYETVSNDSGTEPTNMFIAGTYSFNDGNCWVAVTYGDQADTAQSGTATATTDGSGYTVGLFHSISDNTVAHLLYSDTDFDTDALDTTTIALGLSHTFGGSL